MSIVSKFTDISAKFVEHKGEIGIVLGGVCFGASIVSACLATLELEKVADKHNEEVEEVKDNHIVLEKTSDDGSVITETINDTKAYKRDLTKVYFRTTGRIVRLYAPTACMLLFGVYFLGGSYKSIKGLKKDKKELMAALCAREAIVNRYREEMRERVGEEEERRFYNNIQTKDIEVKEVDDSGKEKKKKVKGAEVLNGSVSGDAFIFDERCGAYVGHDINHNLYIAGLLRNQCSDNLYCNGSLMMFEILDAFGLDRDEVPGAFIRGCLSEKNGGASDKVEMSIRTVWIFDESSGEYVEKILVDPKLDGIIVDKI